MKKYGILATILIATCVAGITLSRAQLLTTRTDTARNVPADVKERMQELSASDPVKRAAAACALGKMGAQAEPAIPALITLLNDGARVEPAVVCFTEYFYETKNDPEFADLKESSPGAAAVQALVAFGHPAVEPLLIALKDSQWRTRKNAAWALQRLRDSRALNPLLAALKDDAWQVRANAAIALGEQRGDTIAEPLIVALNDQSAAVRWSAAIALGLLRDPRAVEPLIVTLKDQNSRTRSFAATSLGLIRDTRGVPALINALKEGDGQLRMQAATALGLIRDERAVAPLTDALKDDSEQVRNQARMALDQLKH